MTDAEREVLESAMEWELPKQARKEIASEMHAGLLAMPPADRIALTRELLEGTGRVVARDVDAPEIATSWFAGGWVACRATMLADDGENND